MAKFFIVVAFFALVLALSFAVQYGLTVVAVWALAGFGYEAPFWPTFAIIFLLSAIFGGGARSSK